MAGGGEMHAESRLCPFDMNGHDGGARIQTFSACLCMFHEAVEWGCLVRQSLRGATSTTDQWFRSSVDTARVAIFERL